MLPLHPHKKRRSRLAFVTYAERDLNTTSSPLPIMPCPPPAPLHLNEEGSSAKLQMHCTFIVAAGICSATQIKSFDGREGARRWEWRRGGERGMGTWQQPRSAVVMVTWPHSSVLARSTSEVFSFESQNTTRRAERRRQPLVDIVVAVNNNNEKWMIITKRRKVEKTATITSSDFFF